MSALGDAAFLAQLQDAFGFRAGRFKRVGKRQSWPLRLTAADVVTAPRTVLVGNAAQTVHPLGAQGFNLGLRDVVALAELLRSCARRAGDPGAPELLDTYAGARRQDRQETTDFSDGLTRLFARRDGFVRDARSLGLAAVARIAPLKQDLAYALMGYRTGGAA
jgi:2-octaprenyl-6-methoxyphenol hydroxylase